VGQRKALEGGEDAARGGPGGSPLGEQSVEVLVRPEGMAKVGLDEPEDHQGEPDDADQGVDAVVVVQEDRSDSQRLFGVAVAQFDQRLIFVQAQQRGGRQPLGQVGAKR
jgi:hypothetical protein